MRKGKLIPCVVIYCTPIQSSEELSSYKTVSGNKWTQDDMEAVTQDGFAHFQVTGCLFYVVTQKAGTLWHWGSYFPAQLEKNK